MASPDQGRPRWSLFTELKKKKPAVIAKTLVVNIVLTMGLFVPLLVFDVARNADAKSTTNAKLPWLRFYETPNSSIYVSWETNAPENSYVEYGTSASMLNFTATNATSTGVHHVLLSGLQQNTTYYYRVGNNDSGTPALGQEYPFMTAPDKAGVPFTFLAVSDTHSMETPGVSATAPVAAGIAREINASHARFIIDDGDFANDGASQSDWNFYFKYSGLYSPSLPIEPVLGNHDNMGGAAMFQKYFCDRPAAPFYYAFNYSSVNFLVLAVPFGDPEEFTPAMMAFATADLVAAARMPYRVVSFHCPLISSGFFGFNSVVSDHLQSLFARDNVSLVIQGHDHHYERLLLGNVTYVVIGGGGGAVDPCHTTWPETQAIASLPHFTRITVSNASMIFEAMTPDNTVFDRATISPSR